MSSKKVFSETDIPIDPFVQFDIWFKEHLNSEIEIPDAMTLGTSSVNGRVSLRTVLLKSYNNSGFVYFTNYKSTKSKHLRSNRYAALLMYWPESGRQVRIEGYTERVSDQESESYFKTRPRESQISAWASNQSSIIPNREHLEKRYLFYKNKFSNRDVSKPPFWGGFRLIPDLMEFWQNGEFRLHDRITYTRKKGVWVIKRLAP